MKDVTKKVVILENLASPYVYQAIIVMRDYNPHLESRAVIEAERIVNAYLDNMKINNGRSAKRTARKSKQNNHIFVALSIAVIAALTALCVIRL